MGLIGVIRVIDNQRPPSRSDSRQGIDQCLACPTESFRISKDIHPGKADGLLRNVKSINNECAIFKCHLSPLNRRTKMQIYRVQRKVHMNQVQDVHLNHIARLRHANVIGMYR
jgi:hypothetical protein